MKIVGENTVVTNAILRIGLETNVNKHQKKSLFTDFRVKKKLVLKKDIGSSKIVVDEKTTKEKPMPCSDYIKVEFVCLGFRNSHMGFSPDNDRTVLFMKSTRKKRCSLCQMRQ